MRSLFAGLSVNGHLIFHDASEKVNTQFLGDIIQAPRPYTLDKIPAEYVLYWFTECPKLP